MDDFYGLNIPRSRWEGQMGFAKNASPYLESTSIESNPNRGMDVIGKKFILILFILILIKRRVYCISGIHNW